MPPTSPSSCRRSASTPPTLRDIVACCAGRGRRHRRRRRVRPPGDDGRRHRGAPAPHQRRTGGRPQRRTRRLTTPLVAFVDTDVQLSTGWLEPLLGHLADERVALVAPRVAEPAGAGTGRPLRAGPLATRPRARAGSDRARHPPQLRPRRRAARARRRPPGDRRLRPRPAGRRGRRRRLAPRRGRVAVSLRAGVGRPPRPAASWRALVSQRVAYGSSAAPLARRHRGALAPARISGWSGGVWGLARRRPAVRRARARRGHDRRARAGSCGCAARRVRAPRRAGPPVRRAQPRRRRPPRLVAAAPRRRRRVPAGAVGRRAVRAARRCSMAVSPVLSTTWPTAPACGRASSPSATRRR